MRTLLVTFAVFGATCAGLAATPARAAGVQVSQSPGGANVAKINIPGSPDFNPDLPVVSVPKQIKDAPLNFPEKARKKKLQGVVLVSMVVDENGVPRDVVVTKPAGNGFDEAAIAAVRQWRFEPALRDGKPVAVALKSGSGLPSLLD